ncbi:MAG: MFS transporter [Caldilineaceae bacterium]|nr:MFS transporter [Caldilineaceae bacterium]
MAAVTVATSGWAKMSPALRSRNFRLFWLGQLVSVIGTSVQVVAEGWLIYDLTGSTFWLGMVGLLGLLPVLPVSLVGGLIIDRVPRRKLILATQVGLMLQAAVFGLLAYSGQLALWHIIVLYFVFGALLAIDHPARRAFLVELVPSEDLANAVALNATVFNLSSLIGYALAGFMLAGLGAGITMLFNGATYLVPIAMLFLIRVRDVGADVPTAQEMAQGSRKSMQGALLEGVRELLRKPELLAMISLMAVVGGLAYPIFGLMAAYAEEVIQVDTVGLGILMAAGALGSVIGTFAVAYLGHHQRGRSLVVVSLLLPLTVALFTLMRTLWLGCLILVLIGIALLIVQSLTITLVQLHIADRVRGRVMSIYSLLHAGSDTMGNVAVGAVAVWLGLPLALAAGAALALCYAIGITLLMPAIRQLD